MHYSLWRHKMLLLVCLLLFLGSPGDANAAVSLMPEEEVQVGAHGIGRTVISGTAIEEFGVEVLGIMKNKGAVGDVIIVRTYGDVIDRSGGVAQGMSGSPIYIDGRLIGAIGYGWSLTDQRTAMVTPIHDMLKLLDRVPRQQTENPQEVQEFQEYRAPRATPLMAAGFGEQALSYLQTGLKSLKLAPYAVGDAPSGAVFGTLEPGSSVGAQLIRGDVSLGALGTVTYVDGDKVLAFGHPFLKRGQAGYFMTNAYIFTTIRGVENSFKVGSTGDAIGTIDQDRGAGIAGEINRYPGIIPMRMRINSPDSGLSREMAVEMVRVEEIVPILAAASLMNAIEKSIDRKGSGTARIVFEISAQGMPGGKYKRENMFFSPENVTEATLAEFYEFVAFLVSNPYNPVTITDIQADISVSQDHGTARILSARPVRPSAKPGEVIDIEVKLKPYRSEPVTRNVSFTVPKEQVPGLLTLSVRGGSFFSLAALLKKLEAAGETLKPARKLPKTFEEMIKDFSNRDRNNDIVVELPDSVALLDETAGAAVKPKLKLTETEKAAADKKPAKPEKSGAAGRRPAAGKPAMKSKGFVTTDYIIEGDTDVGIVIKAGKQ